MTLGLRFIGTLLCAVVAVSLWGCGADNQPTATATLELTATPTTEPTSTLTPESTATQAPEPTATARPEPTAMRRLELTATPRPISPDVVEAFEKVALSMVYIETAARGGSGILIEGGYILTNARVVWPFDAARVFFADGSGFSAVPVRASDLFADLAVLGPVDAPHGGVALAGQEVVGAGPDVLVIGFGETTEEVPKPTITQRVVAGIREFEPTGITYFQTDSFLTSDTGAATPRTGWVLVSTRGDVLGVAGFQPLNTSFEVAASSADVMPRVEQLIAGGDPSELGERVIPVTEGKLRHEFTLENFFAQRAYVINEMAGTEISIELVGEEEGRIAVSDSLSRVLAGAIKDNAEPSIGSFVLQTNDRHFLTVWRLVQGPGKFALASSHQLIHLPDPDDGRRLQVGGSVRGNVDFPGDIDYFVFDLSEDETVEIRASSLLIDTFLSVYPMGSDGQIDVDINAETTLFRNESITVYQAPITGPYIAIVARASNQAPGGYVLSVEPAEPELALTYTALAAPVRSPGGTSTPTP